MSKIYFIDVTNRDGVQTAKLGLSKLEKTLINIYLNEMETFYWISYSNWDFPFQLTMRYADPHPSCHLYRHLFSFYILL